MPVKPQTILTQLYSTITTCLSAAIPPTTDPTKPPAKPREVDNVTQLYFSHTRSHCKGYFA